MATQTQKKTEKEHYLEGAEREYQTTLRVIEAYPKDGLDLKPAESSMPAQKLIWMLALGKMITSAVVEGRVAMSTPPPAPDTLSGLVEGFKKAHKDQIEMVRKLDDAAYEALIEVQAGPKEFMKMRRADALWFFAMDGIHHRGQLSVYLRKSGGKVPSIYGPSGDEPWV
jgi:uncharacterized damage-inducible protein DinB